MILPNPNLAQRGISAAAACLVALFLWLQIDEYGIGESPWLFSILVIAVLLAFASKGGAPSQLTKTQESHGGSPSSRPDADADSSAASSATVSKPLELEMIFSSARNNMEKFFTSVEAGSPNLLSGLRSWKPILIRKAAFMLSFLLLSKKVPDFALTREADTLRGFSIGGLTDCGEMAMLASSGPLSIDRQKLNKQAQHDTWECERTVAQVTECLLRDERFPFDPLYRLLDRDAGMKERSAQLRDDFYGSTFKAWFRLLDDRDVQIARETSNKPYSAYDVSLEGFVARNPPKQIDGEPRQFQEKLTTWLSSLPGYEEPLGEFSVRLPSNCVFMIGAVVQKASDSTLRTMGWSAEKRTRVVNCMAEALSPEDVPGQSRVRSVVVRMKRADWSLLLSFLGSTQMSNPLEDAVLLKAAGTIREALVRRGLLKEDPDGFMTIELPLRATLAVTAALIGEGPGGLGMNKDRHRQLVSTVSSHLQKWRDVKIENVPMNEKIGVSASFEDWRAIEQFLDGRAHGGSLATFAPAIASLIRVERRLRDATSALRKM